MYRLLLVDDEEIEREGMAQFIPWEQHDLELVGAAWNGIEALEIIKDRKPDIVLTDIKMPVMDGIELIREAKKIDPDLMFVVLSGYGEYEFTSQAMEEGIRHYVLKPCNEEKIIDVLERVKEEIRERQSHSAKEADYRTTVRNLLPRAREQIFRNLLLGRGQMREDYQLFLEEIGDSERNVIVLALRSQTEMDAVEQFIIGNILGVFLGEGEILLSTPIQNEIFFLLDASCRERIRDVVERTRAEFVQLKPMTLCAACSREGKISHVHELYREVRELFRVGDTEQQQGFLHYEMFKEIENEAVLLMNYPHLAQTKKFDEILFECYLAYLKMTLKNFSIQQMEEVFLWTVKLLKEDEEETDKEIRIQRVLSEDDGIGQPEETEDSMLFISPEAWELVKNTALKIAGYKKLPDGKEERRMRNILLAVYHYISNSEISIHYLAKKVLFMNEDHFGRIFLKYQKKKFSTFLLEQRIELAKQLIRYDPETKISDIAKMVGYAPDGQYFSKMFKKAAGVSPSEYKDSVLVERNT